MTDKNEFMFLSSDGKTMLHGIAWLPEGEVRAVIQLSHGITEHIDRYDTFARFLSERGLAVYGYDCLGHGQSVTANGIPLDFGDGSSWHTTVNDLYVLHTRLKAAYPDVPHFLIGHSMGSFMVRTYLIRYPGTVQGAVLVGTGWVPEFKLIPALALVNLHAKKSGHTPGDTGMGLVFGRYNSFFRPNRTEYDWLSSDDEIIDAYMSDPLCQNTPTVNLFLAMMQGIRFNQQYGNLAKMDKSVPVLIVSGALDPVGDMGAGVRQTCHEFQRSGIRDCTMRLYVGKRHNVLEEKDAPETIFADIGHWIEERIV